MPFISVRSELPTKNPTGHWSTTPQPPLLLLFCGPPPGRGRAGADELGGCRVAAEEE